VRGTGRIGVTDDALDILKSNTAVCDIAVS